MSRKFLTHLDLGKNEIQNAVVQNLPGAPANPIVGQLYFNTGDSTLYWCKVGGGSPSWISAAGGSSAFPGFGSVAAEATFGAAASDGAGGTVARNDHKHGNPVHDNAAHAAITALPGGAAGGDLLGSNYPAPVIANGAVTSAKILDGTIVPGDVNAANVDGLDAAASMRTLGLTGGKAMPGRYDISVITLTNPVSNNISMSGNYLTGLPAGTPPQADFAASRGYVDSVVQGLDAKQSVQYATTGPISGGGAPNGPGNVDGGTSLVNGERILVKNQTSPQYNGIWLASSGSWTRAADADAWFELNSAFVFVEQGTVNADTGWVCTTDGNGTLNTTPINWVQFSSAGTQIAGAGLTKTGNTIDVVTDGSLTAAADLLSVNYAGTGSAVSAAHSDHTHAASVRVIAASTAAATSTVVNHAFNTRDVTVDVYRNTSPWDSVDCDVERTDANNVTVRFNAATAAGEHRIVVTG